MQDKYAASGGKVALDFPHFPTTMQAVIWRNWGMVPLERIARVLHASQDEIAAAAMELGLPEAPEVDPLWLSRGYITIIRANWHLLPYKQLLFLLGWSEQELEFALKEDDFLWNKLGLLKPETKPVAYRLLTMEEKEQTRYFKQSVTNHFDLSEHVFLTGQKPFSFLNQFSNREIDFYSSDYTSIRDSGAVDSMNSGMISIRANWKIAYPAGSAPVSSYVERFVCRIERRWGVRIGIQAVEDQLEEPGQQDNQIIRLTIRPDISLLSESHDIEVEAERIAIRSVDEPGLLRGLQWLLKQMEEHGGPYLKQRLIRRKTKFDLRCIYSYFAVYGDVLIDTQLDPYPDAMLEALSDRGINGIWLQGILYNLVPWEEASELSIGWEKRIAGLRELTERASHYGIRVYMYFNEPRAMPLSFFAEHPEWQGLTHNGTASLCTSHPDIQKYLRESTARLFREVPGLAGLFTITMSENMTNCYSHRYSAMPNCPRCRERTAPEVIAEVNRCIVEGAVSANPNASIICWTWGWSSYMNEEGIMRSIDLLPDNALLMCTSEEKISTNIAGIPGEVIDYSISIVGPGVRSSLNWATARKRGLQTVAKVQINNSWECSAVPFLPVFDLIEQHMQNLVTSGVSGLLLSWTLGGYPSPNLELASEYYWETTEDPSFDTRSGKKYEWLRSKFGEMAGERIADAASMLSSAFQQFPFNLRVLYRAPQNHGPTNLLFDRPTGYRATMVGIPYDDLEGWRDIYPEEAFQDQFRKLSLGWRKGWEQMMSAAPYVSAAKRSEYEEMLHCTEGAYYHFRSTYLQISYVMLRDRWLGASGSDSETRESLLHNLLAVIDEEIIMAKSLHSLMLRDSKIGYEASNHYYYTRQSLREKVVNCEHVKLRLLEECKAKPITKIEGA